MFLWPLGIVLSYGVGPGDQTQVLVLGGEYFKLLRILWSLYLVIRLGGEYSYP